jgi:hypothetical protein
VTCTPPPAEFGKLDLPVHLLEPWEVTLLRSHGNQYDPIHFHRPAIGDDDNRYRFDAPAQQFGVLYAAESFSVCFIETILREQPGKTGGGSRVLVGEAAIAARSVATIRLLGVLRLVDFVGHLAACRADLTVVSAYPYAVPNQWSLAIHSHPGQFDGIYYPTKFSGQPAVALFDRASAKIAQERAVPMKDWPGLKEVLKECNVDLIPSGNNPFSP